MIESPVDNSVFPGAFEHMTKDVDMDNIFLSAMRGELKLSPKVSLTSRVFSLELTPRGSTPRGFTGLTPRPFTGLTPKSLTDVAAFTPKTLSGLIQALGITPRNGSKDHDNCVVYESEVEPFVISATTTEQNPFFQFLNHDAVSTSVLGDVFDDSRLVDEIMCMFQKAPAALNAMPTHQQPTVPSLPPLDMPCIRKPGTFLNKDGRWIKGKPCRMHDCDKRAQSNGLCKGHGGGARCNFQGCTKSSQGGGFCRAHGGGKRCLFEGCDKGTQRNGFCYLHGGVRSCSVDGCEKKDRGNGKCFAHGGGRKCNTAKTTRRGMFCTTHPSKK